MKYFFDTEFSDKRRVLYPISIGIVAEDGREFYSEVFSLWRADDPDPWIVENVGKYLGDEQPPSVEDVAERIREFVGTEPAEFWAYWAAYDFVILCQLMGGLMKLPRNVSPWVRDLAWLDPTLESIRALKVHNPRPHHALYDARELREQYTRLTGSPEQRSGEP